MYPYGEDQNDEEMEVEMIQDELCKRMDFEDGLWFFDIKHYKLFVSIIEKERSISLL